MLNETHIVTFYLWVFNSGPFNKNLNLFKMFPGRMCRLTYPADSFQGVRVNLIYVVDLGGSVVVLTITNYVDQVVVSKVRNDILEVCECPGERAWKGFLGHTAEIIQYWYTFLRKQISNQPNVFR